MTYLLVTSLPGGPYRLDITEPTAGYRWYQPSEVCSCGHDGPHWHDLGWGCPSLTDVLVGLASRYLTAQEVRP
jgi:hypothetical protein